MQNTAQNTPVTPPSLDQITPENKLNQNGVDGLEPEVVESFEKNNRKNLVLIVVGLLVLASVALALIFNNKAEVKKKLSQDEILLETKPEYITCSSEEFGIEFSCPKDTVVQFWPDIFYNDYVTVTTKPIPTPQESDNLFYEEGLIIIRSKLEEKDEDISSASEWIKKINEEEKASIAAGNIMSAPGPYQMISKKAELVPKWEGAITAKTGVGLEVYIVVENGFVYELRINNKETFSDEELKMMLTSFHSSLSL